MLQGLRLFATGLSLTDINEEQHKAMVDSPIQTWVTGRNHYHVTRRAEYGPGAMSTTSKNIKNARWWTDQPVDQTAQLQLQEKIEQYDTEFKALKAEVDPIKTQIAAIRLGRQHINAEIVCIHIF
jgi:uncharacterized phage-associated protein